MRTAYFKKSEVLLSGMRIIFVGVLLSEFNIFKIQWVLLSNMKIIKAFIGVLLSRSGFLLSGIFLIIFKKGVIILMSLEFYCRLQRNFLKLFKILGFYCRWSSSVFGVLRSPYRVYYLELNFYILKEVGGEVGVLFHKHQKITKKYATWRKKSDSARFRHLNVQCK